jgi:drug/metabolite transporter (DMT)-like permease
LKLSDRFQAAGPTLLFVLLWSAGALFAKWGLANTSPFLFSAMRFSLALVVLVAMAGVTRQPLLPRPGTRWQVARVGFVLSGLYSVAYLLALSNGVTPGVLATILGVQPILTLAFTERPLSKRRLVGLLIALSGLVLVVLESFLRSRFGVPGVSFALAALGAMTVGTIQQKKIDQPPSQVLPLQYAMSLALCTLLLPFEALRVEVNAGLLGSLFAMGVVISVLATLLLYRLIRSGNLVNVTSMFYLVPPGTAVLDWLVFSNVLSPLAIGGMVLIIVGLAVVLRKE